jgi:hypothetical protein
MAPNTMRACGRFSVEIQEDDPTEDALVHIWDEPADAMMNDDGRRGNRVPAPPGFPANFR